MDLQDLVDGEGKDFAAEDFRYTALGGVFLNALQVLVVVVVDALLDGGEFVVKETGQTVNEGLGGEDMGGQVGDLFGDRSKLADRSIELLTLVGILDALSKGHLRGAADARTQLESADIEDVEGDFMAFALLAQ